MSLDYKKYIEAQPVASWKPCTDGVTPKPVRGTEEYPGLLFHIKQIE